MYWDIRRPLSYNCLFNFINGPRGAGKTYGAKNHFVKKFIENGDQFIYLRRYKEEIKPKQIAKFFDDTRVNNVFPGVDLEATRKGTFLVNGMEAGQAMPLSTGIINKGVPFPNIKYIIFDEYILMNGVYHYIPDEVTLFLEFYETIARLRDVQVFFLGNAVTMANPYHLHFDLRLPYGKDIIVKNDILLQYVDVPEYQAFKSQTRFGKIIEGSQYADYAIGNKFFLDDNNFIEKKTSTSIFQYCLQHKGRKYGVWFDFTVGKMFVSDDIDPSQGLTYTVTLADHSPNTLLVKGVKPQPLKLFADMYSQGNCRFESQLIKSVVQEIIKILI